MKRIKPDFNNNILNITATLAEFLGCPNDNPVLSDLKKELNKGYKNVVLLILDGLGKYPIGKNLPADAFLVRHIRRILTSVFPSTTTNATTTLLSNRYPMEHGWFGWCLYFEELKKVVNLFPETDSHTGEPIEKGYVGRVLPVEPFYKRANGEYRTSVVAPAFWHGDEENRNIFETFGEMFGHIERICRGAGKQFVYAYCAEPDSTMHRFGVTSAEARRVIGELNEGVEALCAKLADTLFIVTADHGQIDVDGYIEIYKDEELTSLLEWPPYLEARATAFKVKEGMRDEFAALFRKKYGEDFELLDVQTLIRENYFGGTPAYPHAKLLGDYIAVGTTHKIMKLGPLSHDFKGHHTSLTEEMEVPLILIGDKS